MKRLPAVDLAYTATVLVVGVAIGLLMAIGIVPIVRSCFKGMHCALTLLLKCFLLIKDLVVAAVTQAAAWKTYKKVMPWRNAAAMNASNDRNTVFGRSAFSKTQPDWYGSEDDVDFFLARTRDEAQGKWKCICQNKLGDILQYEAYCRILQGNKTEYMSKTVVKDATAEEMTDFYLDDERRCRWDSMLAHTEQLEAGSTRDRCEVVRWVRSFPFPFLTDREYVIGRRIFRKNGTIYTVSRGIEHAAAPVRRSMVRMDVFYSMWSCRDIVCPWGTEKPACEVVLLHHEQFKIPERLARFAACKGMWGFIRSMGPAVVTFVQNHREASSGFSSSSFSHSGSEVNLSDTAITRSRNEKHNKLMKTARRALFATIVTTAWFVKRNHFSQKHQRRCTAALSMKAW